MKSSKMRALLTLLVASFALTACGSYSSHVQSDTSLGRVVVYRNGIAYYERRARSTGDKLVLTVPQDKVDDFLKSLTVTDAESGDTVPVSYPTAGASEGSQVNMTLQLPPGTSDELVITYITDAPAWKPSYRVVVGDDGNVGVQSWAIVDNTSGEDWEKVRIGVGASSALSFRYDLRSVVHVHRETLGGQRAFAVAPPTGGATHGGKTADKGAETIAIAMGDAELESARRPTEESDDVMAEPMSVAEMTSVNVTGGVSRGDVNTRASAARPVKKAPPVADARLEALASRVKVSREVVVVDGFRAADQSDAVALERANYVRNRLIEMGVAPNRVQANAQGHVPGKSPGVEMQVVAANTQPGDDGEPVGESHFESQSPMTIPRGTSAMVAVLDDHTPGEVVYVFTPDTARGDARYAFKAVRFKNPTESTLEAGPVTVYGAKRFIGEGITDAIPPQSTALIPFALDRQVAVATEATTRETIERIVSVQRGVFTAELSHIKRTQFEVNNRGHEAATVFLRHTLADGWKLGEAPELFEKQGEAYLFAVKVPAGETKTVAIEAATPMTRTLDLRAGAGVDMMRAYLKTRPNDARFVDAVRTLLSIHDEMVAHLARIDGSRAQLVELRERSAELTTQIQRLDRTTVGLKLRTHLQKKLIDVSNRIQDATVRAVATQEELMMARIRFQDAAAELTLDLAAGDTPKGKAGGGAPS